jgi:hypothetical protein
MRWSVLVGGVLATSLALYGIMKGAPLMRFLDLTTVFLVVLLPVAFLLQAHGVAGLKTIQQAICCWLGSDNLAPERLGDACCVVETAAKATIKGALVCVLIGAIQILQMMEDITALGSAMAVMVLSYFYAHCINFVFWGPLGRWLTQHAQENATDTQAQVAGSVV